MSNCRCCSPGLVARNVAGRLRRHSNSSGSPTARIICPSSFPADRNSGRPSPARSSPTRRSSWPMNRRAISILIRNAFRNKRRLALSVSSVAASLFLLITLQVALRELTNPISDEGSSLRIIVRNKVSLAQPLPARQLQTLERIPGIVAVSPFSFYGGLYKGDEKFTSFAQLAVDPARAQLLLADAKIPKAQTETWIADQTSCIVGQMTTDRYGLKIGDRMQFTGQIYPCDLELKIAGIYHGTADDRNVIFHQ